MVQVSLGKKQDPVSKITTVKALEAWLKQKSICPASTKP
jgi:hypothetical protein